MSYLTELKIKAARAALAYLQDNRVIGIGTGSTTEFFIEALTAIRHRIDGCVASSEATAALLSKYRIPLIDLNAVAELPIYVDGADEVNSRCEMIKGGGGALTREKIIASVAQQFICIVDETKLVKQLGAFPLAVEVLPIARSFVARELIKLGGNPEYRSNFLTDNGNIILDVFGLNFNSAHPLEEAIKMIPGVVESGLFLKRRADLVIVAGANGINVIKR